MYGDNDEGLAKRLHALRMRHRALDLEVTALENSGAVDMLAVRRLKKEKLSIKDEIAQLEEALTPDIIA